MYKAKLRFRESKTMARRTKEEAQATRESVLLAALDLFSEKGYSRTTFGDIARRIDMTRGAVYWHFDNKPALLAALIEYVNAREEEMVGIRVRDIQTVEDIRSALIGHARIMMTDEVNRKFEFFLAYQMEWSQELLTETHKKLNEIRKNPFEAFKACFEVPTVAKRLRPGVDLDALILTLAAFWYGLFRMRLGGCPVIDFGQMTEADVQLLSDFDLEQTVSSGFDLIMASVLNEENE
jgi:TetR/AcrR family transcriptional regulator, acrAB operon repressor